MTTRHLLGGLAWVGCLAASVGIGLIPGDYIGESLCGVWGCFPPVQALVSLHLLWLSALMPPAVALARRRPGAVARRSGAFLVVIGLLSVACVVGGGLTDWWYSPADPEYLRYAVRRAGYSLATRTEVPAIQLVVTGVAVVIAARRRSGTESPAYTDTRPPTDSYETS
jgi:hypothetical protein